MFRTHAFLGAAVLSLGALIGMAGPASAQHRHGGHGHHSHGHHHHGHHHHGHYHYGHHHHYNPYAYYGYYSYGYPSYGYSTYAYPNYAYPSYAYPAGSPYAASQGPAAPAGNTVWVQVLLPDPDAQVWVDGAETSSRGMTRVFESPELKPGKTYTYTVRASWTRAGQSVTEERKVGVVAGKISVADFTRPPAAEKVPAPK